MIIKTESGSFYRIDKDKKTIQRLIGEGPPTKRVGEEAKSYSTITKPSIGAPMCIFWTDKVKPLTEEDGGFSEEYKKDKLIIPATITSTVVEIIEKEREN